MKKTIGKLACLSCLLMLGQTCQVLAMNDNDRIITPEEQRVLLLLGNLANLYSAYHVGTGPADNLRGLIDGTHGQLAFRGAAPLPQAFWSSLAPLTTLPGDTHPYIDNVYFNGSDVTGGLPPAFGLFNHVRVLSIVNSRFGNADLVTTINNAPISITGLVLEGTQVTQLPANCNRLPLTVLDLENSPIQTLHPVIQHFERLTRLTLSQTAMDLAALDDTLTFAPVSITTLAIKNHPELHAIPASIGRLTNLVSINLSGLPINDEELSAIIEILPAQIGLLDISNCTNVRHLPENLVRLNRLGTLLMRATPVMELPAFLVEDMPQVRRVLSDNTATSLWR